MKLKENVRFGNPAVAIAFAAIVCNDVYREFNYDMVVTSLNDSTHSENSLHYRDRAFDLRINNVNEAHVQQIATLIRSRLTDSFDVVLETDHIHVEYDPK